MFYIHQNKQALPMSIYMCSISICSNFTKISLLVLQCMKSIYSILSLSQFNGLSNFPFLIYIRNQNFKLSQFNDYNVFINMLFCKQSKFTTL
jgi:hypothetical protein